MPVPLSDIFGEFSAREISRGYEIVYPVKTGTDPAKPYPYKIEEGTKTVKGTRISQYALRQFASGKWTPSAKTTSKLKNFYHRVNYSRLRSSGASVGEAKRHYRKKNVQKIVADFRKSVLAIAKGKDVSPLYVAYMMTRADPEIKDIDYWKFYTREKGWESPDDPDIDDGEWDEYMGEEYIEI